MNSSGRPMRFISMTAGGNAILFAAFLGAATATLPAYAACHLCAGRHGHGCQHCQRYAPGPGDVSNWENGGAWYWMHSPEQEKRVVMNLYNRYCIRCHGVDGRGVWDIPDVPDFTDPVWQSTRPDAYRTRVLMEGRGAVMPSFRGTLTLEEACAMARYLHTFVPGTEVPRPVPSNSGSGSQPSGTPPTTPRASATLPIPAPAPNTRSPFTR